MCVIAGYSGKRRAAPLLIEMMKKIEYVDGGYATGIATVHEGKIYYAKAIGDVEMLLRTTDAMDLPGTVGIIHTRPNGEFFTITHPYFDADMTVAMVENGARNLLKADLAVSLTGIAGPDGGSAEKPVGLVWFGLSSTAGTVTEKKVFSGDREAVRAAAIEHALRLLLSAV